MIPCPRNMPADVSLMAIPTRHGPLPGSPVIDKALDLIAETTGERLTAEEIPTDDEATYQLLQEGRTVGVFQLESSGMQELVRKMEALDSMTSGEKGEESKKGEEILEEMKQAGCSIQTSADI